MNKQDLVKLILEKKKELSVGSNIEEKLLSTCKFHIAFEDNYDELLEEAKEIIELIKDPEKLHELEQLVSEQEPQFIADSNSVGLEQNQLTLSLFKELKEMTDGFDKRLIGVSEKSQFSFIEIVINRLKEKDVIVNEEEIIDILKLANSRKRRQTIMPFNDEINYAVTGDVDITVKNIISMRNNHLDNMNFVKKYESYVDELSCEIIELLKKDNLQRPEFRMNYFEIIRSLRVYIREYKRTYMHNLGEEFMRFSEEIDRILEEVMRKNNIETFEDERSSKSELAAMFK